ncbi:MAG TPA: hypothetical protein ENN33_06925 [Ignavibacteria bacterium]|nr:hypothetical protein [Ignavibacteria bacterium]
MTKEFFKKGLLFYFFGNLSSKIITLLLLPLFTFYLSQEEYGLFDILNTIVMLFVPIVGVQLFEGVLRYLLDTDDKEQRNQVVSTSFYFLSINLILLNIFFAAITSFVSIPHSTWLILYFNFYFVNFFLQRIARGIQLQKAFALSGIVNTLTIAVLSIILLVIFDFKTDGLLIAYFGGSLVSSFYLLFKTKVYSYIYRKSFNSPLLSKLLVYSYPLLFDAMLWWIMNLSDRLILGYLQSPADVGIYSVANKFAALLTFINHIFYLVWQEFAILQSKQTGSSKEYRKIFSEYLKVQFTGVILLMPVSKIAIELFIDEKFVSSYLFVPPLLIGVMFSAFAAFYGLFYQIEKNTLGALFTSLVAGIINITANILLIPIYGIWAAALTTLLSFLVLWLIRIVILKRFIAYETIFSLKFINAIILLAMGLFLYYSEGILFQVINLLGAILLFVYLNQKLIRGIVTRNL